MKSNEGQLSQGQKWLLQYSLLQQPALYCVLGVLVVFVPLFRNDWWGLAVFIMLITVYGWLSKDGEELTRIEVGDNCYFIGFVYTLLVVTAALFIDAEKIVNAGNKEALGPLLKTIGIALGSSIWGMICRLRLAHGAGTPENEFDRITNNIALAANKLSRTVKDIEFEAEQFALSLKTHSDMLMTETGKVSVSLGKSAEKVVQSFSAQISVMWERIEFKELSAALKKITEDHQAGIIEISETQETALQHLNAVVSASIRSIESAQATTESLRDRVNDNLADIGQVISGLDSSVGKLGSSFQPLVEMHTSLKNEVKDNLAHVNEMRATFESILRKLHGDINSIKDLVAETHSTSTANSSDTERKQNLAQSLPQEQPAVPFYYLLLFALEFAAIIALAISLYFGGLNETSASLEKLERFAGSVQMVTTIHSGDTR